MDEEDELIHPEEFGEGTAVAVGTGDDDDAALTEIPSSLPVLPLRNTVLFPFLLSPLLVNSERSKKLIDAVLLTPHRLLVCSAVRHAVEGSPGPADVNRVGTAMRIAKMLKFPDDSYRLLVQGVARIRVTEFESEDPFLRGRVERLHESGDLESVDTTALMRNVAQQFTSLVAESSRLSDELQLLAGGVDDPSKLADLAGSNLELDVAGKQRLLEELDVPNRLRGVLEGIARERDAQKVERDIREKVQSDIGKTQRDYMLRQQLEAIRQELGEGEDQESDGDKLRERVEAAGMSEEAEKQAIRELDRLEQMPSAAAEYGVIRSYLEWMRFSASWGRRAPARRRWGARSRAPWVGNSSVSRWAACTTKPRSAATGAPTSAPCPVASCRACAAPAPATRSSCWTKSTRSAPTSAATLPRRCWRCSTRSRTRRSATTISRCPSTSLRCCSSRRPTRWTRCRRRCATAWR
jgi:Lon protease-like protein